MPALIDPDNRLANYAVTLTNGALTVVHLATYCTSILKSPRGTFALEFRVCAGRTYRLQRKGNLADAVWTTLGNDFTSMSWSVTLTNVAGTNGQEFFRLLDVTAP